MNSNEITIPKEIKSKLTSKQIKVIKAFTIAEIIKSFKDYSFYNDLLNEGIDEDDKNIFKDLVILVHRYGLIDLENNLSNRDNLRKYQDIKKVIEKYGYKNVIYILNKYNSKLTVISYIKIANIKIPDKYKKLNNLIKELVEKFSYKKVSYFFTLISLKTALHSKNSK